MSGGYPVWKAPAHYNGYYKVLIIYISLHHPDASEPGFDLIRRGIDLDALDGEALQHG